MATHNHVDERIKMSSSPYHETSRGNDFDGLVSPSSSDDGSNQEKSIATISKFDLSQRREWTDEECVKLMSLWRESEILYNNEHPNYYSQNERKIAMEQIANELNISVKDITDKMHSLRTYYGSQRQRIEAKELANPNTPYVSRWKYYNNMSFLRDSLVNRANKSNLRKSRRNVQMSYVNPHDEHEKNSENQLNDNIGDPTIYVTKIQPLEFKTDESRKRRFDMAKNDDDDEESIYQEKHIPSIDQISKSDQLFGEMIVNSLQHFHDEQQKELLKLEIQTLIYNTRFSKH
ncbi:uncharacterized protein LOC101238213 isoform X2 [Hydra vulgaris]|uniref:Uncharacterized protein LOC101238213 isoform X2 n=2 Tax=Hydra vulgaris TaxID=6087 RepID=A0ABM4CK85_HYDVU